METHTDQSIRCIVETRENQQLYPFLHPFLDSQSILSTSAHVDVPKSQVAYNLFIVVAYCKEVRVTWLHCCFETDGGGWVCRLILTRTIRGDGRWCVLLKGGTDVWWCDDLVGVTLLYFTIPLVVCSLLSPVWEWARPKSLVSQHIQTPRSTPHPVPIPFAFTWMPRAHVNTKVCASCLVAAQWLQQEKTHRTVELSMFKNVHFGGQQKSKMTKTWEFTMTQWITLWMGFDGFCWF